MPAWLPIRDWLPSYDRRDLRSDVGAGLTTAVMLIPQAMAYALLAGLPPIHGLYAATAPLLAYAVFGSSRQLAVGPVAMDSLLVGVGVAAIATVGTEAYLAYAILLAAMVGIVQVGLGLARAGFLVNFLSRPVISGFTSAAALIIGLSQLEHLLGVELRDGSGYVHEVVIAAVRQVAEISAPTLAVGLGSVGVLVGLQKLAPKAPRALIVVVIATVLVWLLGLDQAGVKIVGAVPSGLPRPSLPVFEPAAIVELAPTAVAIAFVAFMEAISVAKAVAGKAPADASGRPQRIDPNQELIGLGAANLAGSLFGGFPVAGGFSRTAVNAQAGARTQLAGIVTALVVILTLLLLTPLFYYLPKAALAAIIMTAVFGLVDVAMVKRLWKIERSELVMLALTFAATLALGIVQGIGVGVLASIVWFVARQTRPHMAVLGRLPGTTLYRKLDRYPEATPIPGVIAVRFDSQFYFGNVDFLERTIEELLDQTRERGDPTYAIVIDASSINRLDSSADTALSELASSLRSRGIELYFGAVKGPVVEMMQRSGLYEQIGAERIGLDVHDAVLAAERARASS